MGDTPYDPRAVRKTPTLWEIAEKILIPLALVLLAASQVKVAREQVRVAELQLERQTSEASSNLQLKYIELFYHDLADPDPRKRETGIALLAAMQPNIAQIVTRVVFADPLSTPKLKEQASATLLNAQRFGALVNYRIVIYFPKAHGSDAEAIQKRLTEFHFPNKIELRERDGNFLTDAARYGYHVRYEETYEGEAAENLLRLLPECLPGHSFKPVRVIGKTSSDGAITIFLYP